MARKIFSCFFAVLVVPILVIFLLFLGLKTSVLSADFYKATIRKADIFNQILNQSGALLNSMVGGEQKRFGLGPINANDLQTVLKESISPAWLEEQTSKIADNFFIFAYGNSSTLEMIIPLTELKKSLPENLNKAFRTKIESLSVCTPEQEKKLQSPKEGESISFDCRPKNMNANQMVSTLLEPITGKEGLITKLPDQYDLGQIINKNPSSLSAIQRFFYFANLIFLALLVTSSILLLSIALLNMTYLPGMLKWLAIPVLISSAAVLIFGFFGQFTLRLLLGGYLSILSTEMKTVVNSLIKIFSENLSFQFIFPSGIIMAIAIALLILALVLTKKYPHQSQMRIDDKIKLKK